jgi:predicted O-methyltransferase YrrM
MDKQQLENIWEQAKSIKEDEALQWLVRQTHTRTNHARMLVGAEEGAFLELFVQQVKAQRVLELGTFTGYSAIRLARGGAHVDAVEINDELEDLIREGFERAGVTDKIDLHFTDAKIILKDCKNQYDIVFIDANKREYPAYYELVFPLVKDGGYILADNVLWSGKLEEALQKKETQEIKTEELKPDILKLDAQTSGIVEFYLTAKNDRRVEFITLPIRDGLSIIRKK